MATFGSRSHIVRQHESADIIVDGKVFTSGGSSVDGHNVSGYLHKSGALTRWNGRQLIPAGRYIEFTNYRCGEFGDSGTVCGWRLPNGRFIVGWAMMGDGSLFRGELIEADDDEEARRLAESIAEHWVEIDSEDQQNDLAVDDCEEVESIC